MKKPDIKKIVASGFAFIHRHFVKMILAMILVLFAVGGVAGWRYYTYSHSSEAAFQTLRSALVLSNADQLARMVDFNNISYSLCRAVSKTFPFFHAGENQLRELDTLFQTSMLQTFLTKENANRGVEDKDESEEKKTLKPVILVPTDFGNQLVENLALVPGNDDFATITSKVSHPQLKQTFNFVFSMQKRDGNWVVRELSNASELVAQFKDAILGRLSAMHQVLTRKNDETVSAMNAVLPISTCTADAGLLSDGRTLLVVIRVEAPNIGKPGGIIAKNMDVDARLQDQNGKMLVRRFLNVAKSVAPGQTFDHRWNLELDANTEEGKLLSGAGPLVCNASWRTLGLSNSRVLHRSDIPDMMKNCIQEGHDHPEGLCMMPLFRN